MPNELAIAEGGHDMEQDSARAVTREAHLERPEARLTTSFLQMVRDRSYVRTDREVVMVEGRRTLIGRGMEYDNQSQVMQLRSRVHGRFEPESGS